MHVHVHVNTHEWTYTQNYRQARRCIILYAPTGSLELMLTGDILQVQHILDELNNTGIGYREIHAQTYYIHPHFISSILTLPSDKDNNTVRACG